MRACSTSSIDASNSPFIMTDIAWPPACSDINLSESKMRDFGISALSRQRRGGWRLALLESKPASCDTQTHHQDECWRAHQPADPGKVVSTNVGCGPSGQLKRNLASPPLGVRLWRIIWSFSAPPRDLHIPYFAMGAPSSREN